MGMLGPRDRENPMRETTAYRAISISSHMVGIPGHCEKECDLKIRNDEIHHWDPTGGHGTPREATGPHGRQRDPTPGRTKSAGNFNPYTTKIARTPTEQALFGEPWDAIKGVLA